MTINIFYHSLAKFTTKKEILGLKCDGLTSNHTDHIIYLKIKTHVTIMQCWEKTKMNDINAHICPTCGGQLSVNIERQMYECPFCGGSFDYDYFREENVLDIAAQALKNNEFNSADRAYDFMLEKEPDNFEALRGKALIAMKISETGDIRNPDLFSRINYESVCKEIDRGIGSSKPEDREYFTVMKDIVDAGHEYIDEKDQIGTSRAERDRLLKKLVEYVNDRNIVGIYSPARVRPKKAVILTIFCYMFCCLMVFLGYRYATRNPYSKAEDLSQYETTQTSDPQDHTDNKYNANFSANDFSSWYSNHKKYEEALAREEQRKINYDAWEKSHKNTGSELIMVLCFATVVFTLIIFMLFMCSRALDSEISKIQDKADEQEDIIRNHEERMAELRGRIAQGYERLINYEKAL